MAGPGRAAEPDRLGVRESSRCSRPEGSPRTTANADERRFALTPLSNSAVRFRLHRRPTWSICRVAVAAHGGRQLSFFGLRPSPTIGHVASPKI